MAEELRTYGREPYENPADIQFSFDGNLDRAVSPLEQTTFFDLLSSISDKFTGSLKSHTRRTGQFTVIDTSGRWLLLTLTQIPAETSGTFKADVEVTMRSPFEGDYNDAALSELDAAFKSHQEKLRQREEVLAAEPNPYVGAKINVQELKTKYPWSKPRVVSNKTYDLLPDEGIVLCEDSNIDLGSPHDIFRHWQDGGDLVARNQLAYRRALREDRETGISVIGNDEALQLLDCIDRSISMVERFGLLPHYLGRVTQHISAVQKIV